MRCLDNSVNYICKKGPFKTLGDLFFKRKVMELKIKVMGANGWESWVTEGERASKGWGFGTFIAHTDLYKPEEDKEYLLNDTLIFRITNIEVTSL